MNLALTASFSDAPTIATMTQSLLPFILTTFALVGSPGPNTLSVAAVGAAFGRQQGMPYLVGICLGVGLVVLLVASGLAGLVLAYPGVKPIVTICAGMYLCYLAFKIATAKPLQSRDDQTGATPPVWYAGTLLSLANPKAYASVAATFSQFVLIDNVLSDSLLKAAIFMSAIVLVNVAWLLIGSALSHHMSNLRTSKYINRLFAILLLLSVALVVV